MTTTSIVFDQRFAVGCVGFVTSLIMFGYPLFSSIRLIRISGSVGQSSPNPYLVTLANSFVWALYCTVRLHSYLPLSVNIFGGVSAILYIGIYLRFSDYTRRIKVVCWLVAEVVILAALTAAVFYFGVNKQERYTIAGVMCIISNIGAYYFEFLTVGLVISTKKVEHMPLFASLVFFANSVVWCTFFVFIEIDGFFLATYLVGSFIATLELILYVCIIFPSVCDRLLLALVKRISF